MRMVCRSHLNRLSAAGAVGADHGSLQVVTGGIVEGSAAGYQGQALLRGWSNHLVERYRCRVVLPDPFDGEGVGLPVVAGDDDIVPRLQRGQVVEHGRPDIPVIDVAGHDDITDFPE